MSSFIEKQLEELRKSPKFEQIPLGRELPLPYHPQCPEEPSEKAPKEPQRGSEMVNFEVKEG